jgi:predicted nucleotidyltransferase
MQISLPSVADRLPLHKRRLEAASRVAMKDSEVLGMLIGGSFASGEADDYSDLDMQLVVKEAVEQLVPKLRSMADEAGPVVAAFFAEHVGLPHMLIVLYEDLVHADFEPVRISDVGTRNAGLSTHVLWERDRAISTALDARYEEDRAVELAWLEDRVWTWSWYVQTKILRGELYEALGGLQDIRDRVLFRLLAMHRDERPSSARRVESRLGPWKETFAATVPTLTQESTMDALKASIHLYVDLADSLQKRHGVQPAEQARVVVLRALKAGLAWSSEREAEGPA